ncbi:MAG: Type secretion system domain protein [Aeromicrobium sp.]|nr:Type secretion system domain protein [Aeromicrobium sp.]
MILFLGVVLVLAALSIVYFGLLSNASSRVDISRRRPPGSVRKSPLAGATEGLVELVDRVLRSRGWVPFTAKELELAAVRMTPGYLVVLVGVISFIVLMVVATLTQGLLLALLAAAAVPLLAKLVLRNLAGRRRKEFSEQLDETLQLLAAALRAGHGLTRSFDSVSREVGAPMSEELARVVNENRIGRDLVDAVSDTAERMQSSDFRWVAEAVGIQRETGGNLNEVLDRVGDTIRERNELKREVQTLSAEGRMSAIILAVLPFLTVALLTFINPTFMNPLFTTRAGAIAIVVSAVMFVVGGLWMKIVVNVKV